MRLHVDGVHMAAATLPGLGKLLPKTRYTLTRLGLTQILCISIVEYNCRRWNLLPKRIVRSRARRNVGG